MTTESNQILRRAVRMALLAAGAAATAAMHPSVANAQAAAWLYNRYGPGRWTCQ